MAVNPHLLPHDPMETGALPPGWEWPEEVGVEGEGGGGRNSLTLAALSQARAGLFRASVVQTPVEQWPLPWGRGCRRGTWTS